MCKYIFIIEQLPLKRLASLRIVKSIDIIFLSFCGSFIATKTFPPSNTTAYNIKQFLRPKNVICN